MMFYLVPPAGTPFSISNVLQILKSRFLSSNAEGIFADSIKSHTGAKFCYFLNSGRTALLIALKALSKLTDPAKNEVVIPAYTCPSVASAVARAGLKIKLVDINPETMDFDYGKLADLDFSNVLAVVGCNLFGIASDWNALRAIGREHNVFLIDDAAQAMGSKFKDGHSGCAGDIGFYSLGRGKNLSTYSGGVLVTSNEKIAGQIEEQIGELKKVRWWTEIAELTKLVISGLFLRPRLYWLPDIILFHWIPYIKQFLGRGEAFFVSYFPVRRITPVQEWAASVLYPALKDFNDIRLKKAREMAGVIIKSGRISVPGYRENESPIYLRLPLLLRDRPSRDRAISELRKRGIQASTMYPSTIRRLPGVERYLTSEEDDYPGAEEVVSRLLTLPTHPYMDEKHMHIATSYLTQG